MAKARIDIEVVQAGVAERRLAQIARAEQRLNVQFKGGIITSEQLRKSTQRLNRAKALLTRRLNTNSASLRRGTRAAATMTTTLGSLRSMAAGVGVAFGLWQVTRILGSATRAAIDFEAEFANVSTLMNTETPKGVKQLKLLEEQILALDSRLGGATELTRGLYQALSAGVEPAKAVRFVGEAALFAKAGLTDIFTAVDLLTTVINAYGKSTEDAAAVSSTLFKIVELGKTTVGLLAGSFGRLAPTAAQLNIELPQLGATLTTLTKAGLSTAEAMTAMAAILNVFVAPEAKQRLDELGISQEKLRDIITKEGLNAALRELNILLKGDTAATAALFREREAQKGIFTLLGKGTRSYAKDLETLTKAQEDATATMIAAEKQFDTTKSKISELSGELEKLKIALNLDEAAERAVIALTKITRAITGVIKRDEVQRLFGLIGNLFTGFNASLRAGAKNTKAMTFEWGKFEEVVPRALEKTKQAEDAVTTGTRKLTEEEKKAREALQEFLAVVDSRFLGRRFLKSFFDMNDAIHATREGLKGLKAEMDLGPAAQKLDLPNFAVIDAIADEERKLAVLRAQLAGDTVAAILLQEDKRLQETLANLEKLEASEEDLARAREVLAAQTAVKVAEENKRAFEQMAQQIDFFFQRAALGAKSFSDLFKQIWTQLLSFFISQVSRMVAAWILGQRQMQAASAGGGIGGGGGGLQGILGTIFGGGGGLGGIFGGGTGPGGTPPFNPSVPATSSRLISAGAGVGVARFSGAQASMPTAAAGSATGIAAQQASFALLGLDPISLAISAAIALGLFGLKSAKEGNVVGAAILGPAGILFAIFRRGKIRRRAAAAEEAFSAQLIEVVKEYKRFQLDFQSAIEGVDQLWAQFQQAAPQQFGKYGRRAVRNIAPFVAAIHGRINEIQAARDARLLLSAGSLIPEFSHGGLVPSLLHPGEFVIRREAVQQAGVQNLERINRGEAPAGNVNINITINPSPGMDERTVGEMAARAIARRFRNRGLQFGG